MSKVRIGIIGCGTIGNVHAGAYQKTADAEITALCDILPEKLKAAAGNVPLVLHGGSGTPADQLQAAIAEGIAKVNVYSELTAAWNTAMRDFLNQRGQMTCWFAVACAEPDAAMRESMRAKMRLFGSVERY